VSVAPDGALYASGGYGHTAKDWDSDGGVCKSVDGGKTWERLLAAPCVSNVAVCPSNPKLVYCTVEGGVLRPEVKGAGVWRSADGGKTWLRVNKGLSTNCAFTRVRFNPNVTGELWLGTFASGYYRSIDPEGLAEHQNKGL